MMIEKLELPADFYPRPAKTRKERAVYYRDKAAHAYRESELAKLGGRFDDAEQHRLVAESYQRQSDALSKIPTDHQDPEDQ